MQESKKGLKGEITVFLTLISVVLISFIIAILDSAVIKTYGNTKKADAEAAVFSLFGEYEDELFNDYNILAVDSSYGKKGDKEKYIEDKLRYFGTVSMDHSIEGIQLLTDENAAAFRSQALKYITGVSAKKDIHKFDSEKTKWTDIYNNGLKAHEKDCEFDTLLKDLKNKLSGESSGDENAFEILEDSKNSSFLEQLLPDESEVSNRKINLNEMVSKRNIKKGYGLTYNTGSIYGGLKDIAFNEYILSTYSYMGNEKAENPGLLYEAEYIIGGMDSDKANLEKVAKDIIYMRLIPNYNALIKMPGKMAEVKTLSTTLAVLLKNPALKEPVENLLKWLFAYTESKCDTKALMAGVNIPEIKTADTWQCGLYDCFTNNVTYNLSSDEHGLSYKDFLRILLFKTDNKKATLRAVDMTEINIAALRKTFKADNCFVKIKLSNKAELLKGFSYSFPITFGYVE